MRKTKFANDEYYHIFNRGVDKREVFSDKRDFSRFLKSMNEFNVIGSVGGMHRNEQINRMNNSRSLASTPGKLVEFVAYCLNSNHVHFILRQLVDNGISMFMHKIGTGHTKFYNTKYDRSGSLFQGTYKAVHVNSDNYLTHLSVYINLNDRVHRPGNRVSKSSWGEYVKGVGYGNGDIVCENKIILDQFKNRKEYKEFAENSLKDIQERKDMKKMLLD